MSAPHSSHPPDRSHIPTERRNSRSTNLDQLSTLECVRLINSEDATVAPAVARAAEPLARLIDAIESRIRAAAARGAMGRLIYLGAGTSGRLGVLDASECPPTFQTDPNMVVGIIAGGDASLRRSSEGMEDDPQGAHAELDRLAVGVHDTVIGIAAGATTPYVLGALAHAHARGAATAFLTCSPGPTPPGIDHHIAIDTGPEVVTGSTRMKAGTATKMALNIITTTLMVRLGKVYENLMVDLRASNAKLRDRAARIVATLCSIDRTGALSLLDAAGGSAKVATVMGLRGCRREEAERLLTAADGRLRDALSA
jgi:N-acetylmuramic acid 6-phosphate etherase